MKKLLAALLIYIRHILFENKEINGRVKNKVNPEAGIKGRKAKGDSVVKKSKII